MLRELHDFFLPTQANVYRPGVLGRGWLVFFLALSLAIEGFLMSGLVANQSDTFLTAAAGSNMAAVGAATQTQSTMRSFGRQLFRTMSDPEVDNTLLVSVGALVLVVVVLAFFVHLDVQAHDMLLGGIVVAAIAFLIVAANIHFLSTQKVQEAAGISALAP